MTVLEKNSKDFKDNYVYNSKKVLEIIRENKEKENSRTNEKKTKGE